MTTLLIGLAALVALFYAARRLMSGSELADVSQIGKKMKVVRNVTRTECPWLKQTIASGTVVYRYPASPYAKPQEDHVLVTLGAEQPIFEMPENSVVDTGPSLL